MEQKMVYKKESVKPYRVHVPASAEEYLQAVRQAEHYLSAHVKRTPEGIYWASGGTEKNDNAFAKLSVVNLYGGSAGILYFYHKLYRATKEEAYRKTMEEALRYLLFRLPGFLPEKVYTLQEYGAGVSLDLGVLGLAGIGFVLEDIYETYRQEEIKEALHTIGSYYLSHANREGDAAYFTGSSTMITDTAVLLYLIRHYELFSEPEIRELILAEGEWYLAQGEWQEDGTLFYHGLECVWEGIKLNFEVGVSGSGYTLARLYEFTQDERYLKAAEACAAYVVKQGIAQEKGYLVPFRQDLGKDSPLYLGTCSGVAGTARLFYLLYRLTGEKKYLEEIEKQVDGIESVHAPEWPSTGFWNNTNLCCGHAGLLQFFVAMYQATKEERYRELAHRTAAVLLGEKDVDKDGASWLVATERSHPENTSRPLGYYMGVAGIAGALLQMYESEQGDFHWNRLPDDPFPS